MRRALVAAMATVFGLCGLAALPLAAAPVPEDGAELQKLAADFWAWRAVTQPYSPDDIPRIERPNEATSGKRDWSRTAIEKQRRELGQFETRWKGLACETGPAARVADCKLLGSALARVRWELDRNARWKRDPNFYVEQSLTALVEALVVPPPFDEARSRELLARVRDIPGIVKSAEENLEKPPAPFARVAIAALDGVGTKLATVADSLAPVTTLKKEELTSALAAAATALEQYRVWLQARLASLPEGAAVGRENYEYFLKNVALLPYTPEQLLQMSKQEWARTVAFEVYEENRDHDVPPLTIPASTEEWIKKAGNDELAIRAFLEAKNILTVPATVQHYTLRAMPEYLRAVSDFGETDDFTGPSRLKDNCVRYVNPPSQHMGFFWRATAEDPRPITVHEGVPGHYFQLAISWQNPDAIRRHYYDSGANEGIGFYAEEMMLQAGLFDDSPHSREIIYHFMRLRALRVEVDVKLALGIFTLEQAAQYLETHVPMDRETARQEATMFATTPGQAISYQVGKVQIFEFLAEAKKAQGQAFSLRRFHDALWSNGNVPIALQQQEFLATHAAK
ncbi:MAG TPA: DUF885 domain-containing protein [Dongiaceae bacterium]|nr:DUF885 domain-containing protein [Dongiaceae bacterium]